MTFESMVSLRGITWVATKVGYTSTLAANRESGGVEGTLELGRACIPA